MNFLICYMIKWLHDLVGRGVPPTLGQHPAKFDNLRCCGSANLKFSFCHLTTWLKDHVVWWVWYASTLSDQPAKFNRRRCCGSTNIKFFICHVIKWSKGHVT